MALAIEDQKNWRDYAELMGFKVGDRTAYIQWSGAYGHLRGDRTKDARYARRPIFQEDNLGPPISRA